MRSGIKNILLTGLPGCGKTTLVKKLAEELREFRPAGFFTEEVREGGSRKGFKLISVAGNETGLLAHVRIDGPPRVGKYGVDLPGFEHFLAELRLSSCSSRLVIIDEIGKMECRSARFRELVASLLDGSAPLVAAVALKAGGFIDAIRRRGDVDVSVVTGGNREKLRADIAERIRSLLNPGDRGSH